MSTSRTTVFLELSPLEKDVDSSTTLLVYRLNLSKGVAGSSAGLGDKSRPDSLKSTGYIA